MTVGGSQKGLMLPPGLSFNAISPKALEASKSAGFTLVLGLGRDDRTDANGFFPYAGHQPPLRIARGDPRIGRRPASVFARHDRHAEATRRAVRAWNLEILCQDPAEYSSSLTAVMMPAGHDADVFRKVVLDNFDMSLGQGLSKLSGKIFRIGHLGDFNDLMLAGTLAGVEMGLGLARVPQKKGGVLAAMEHLAAQAESKQSSRRAA